MMPDMTPDQYRRLEMELKELAKSLREAKMLEELDKLLWEINELSDSGISFDELYPEDCDMCSGQYPCGDCGREH